MEKIHLRYITNRMVVCKITWSDLSDGFANGLHRSENKKMFEDWPNGWFVKGDRLVAAE